ncbi:hypothetical protein [Pantoea sp. B65]|uniref:hypothetical protein n=1 Tax=Pantoea sp. B65 TaxID=2813359 RepID=UPI0039B58396
MKSLLRLCLLTMLIVSPAALACRSQRDACYKNCNRLSSPVARFFCYLGGSQTPPAR